MNKKFVSNLPQKFVRHTLELCGTYGERWLNDLPEIIKEISGVWSLKVAKPLTNLTYNFVAPCVREHDGGQAVLKIAPPLNVPEIFNEAEFLQMADGKGAVKLLEINKNYRAILLERLTPGENLKQVCAGDAGKAVEIAVNLLSRILKEPPKGKVFVRLEDWFVDFFKKSEKTQFPRELVAKTLGFYEELSSDARQKFLIHGDLHHENILSAAREPFLAIDPKGITGEIGYEISVFLNNHLWWLSSEPELPDKLNYAVEQFSEAFEIESADLRKWAYAQIILSAWWTFEENGKDWERELTFAEVWKV